MLTRNSGLSSPDEYFSDSLLKTPTISSSVFNNLAMGIATPVIALNMMNSDFSKKPEGQAIMNAYQALELENETPGMSTSQWLLAQGSNMLGQALNPISWGLAETGALASKGLIAGAEKLAPDAATVFMRTPLKDLLSKPVSKYIPEMIGKEGEEKALSLGLMSENTLKNFGIFAGAAVPQGIVDNFNNDTGHIAWGGVARSMGEMGAFGVAVGSIPFGWGVLRGKVNRGLDREPNEPVDRDALNQALEKGHITEKEHKLFNDYLDLEDTPEDTEKKKDIEQRFTEIINENGHRANAATNEAMVEILSPDDMSNLHGVIADQLAGNVPEDYKQALTDFVIHGRMDYLRQDPKTLDGVRGYVDYINQRLENKNSKLAEADVILDEHLTRGTKENMPFSQKELYKYMKQVGFESSHIQHLPSTIPENLKVHIKTARAVEALEKENKLLRRRYEKKRNSKYTDLIKENERKIKILQKNIDDYLARNNRSEEAKKDVKSWNERVEKFKNENENYKEKDKLITSGKRFLIEIEKNENKIKELNESLPKILTPKEELHQLRKELLGKGLKKNFDRSAAYHRLLDLSNVWNNARTLLDRIHLEHEYNKQTAFRDLVNQVIKISDSNMPKMAKPENVMDYMRRRLEGTSVDHEPISEVKRVVDESKSVPVDADEVLAVQKIEIDKSKAKGAKKDFIKSTDKYTEFKKSENIFKNFIQCVLGAGNA